MEGDVLDWADPEETEAGTEDEAEYSDRDIFLDDIDDIEEEALEDDEDYDD